MLNSSINYGTLPAIDQRIANLEDIVSCPVVKPLFSTHLTEKMISI